MGKRSLFRAEAQRRMGKKNLGQDYMINTIKTVGRVTPPAL